MAKKAKKPLFLHFFVTIATITTIATFKNAKLSVKGCKNN